MEGRFGDRRKRRRKGWWTGLRQLGGLCCRRWWFGSTWPGWREGRGQGWWRGERRWRDGGSRRDGQSVKCSCQSACVAVKRKKRSGQMQRIC